MYRIIFSLLLAVSFSFSSPVYVTIEVKCTDTIKAHDTSITLPEIDDTFSYTLMYDIKIAGTVSNYWGPDDKIGVYADLHPSDTYSYKLEDHPFPVTPKEGIKTMNSLYRLIDYQDGSVVCVIDKEHMFALKWDHPDGGLPLDSFSYGVGCELVTLKEPYNDTLIYSQNPCPWDPIHSKSGDEGLYAGFLFKFKVTRVADQPPTKTDIHNTLSINKPNNMNISQNNSPGLLSIQYNISFSSPVKLEVYDIQGRLINVVVDKFVNKGSYMVDWDSKGYSTGMYCFKLSAGNNTLIRKANLIK